MARMAPSWIAPRRSAEGVVVEAEEAFQQQEMPRRGHRHELVRPSTMPRYEGLEKVERHEDVP